MAKKAPSSKQYYFIDIDSYSRQILAWGTDTKGNLDGNLKNGSYRVFLSKGQYNKLVAALDKARS